MIKSIIATLADKFFVMFCKWPYGKITLSSIFEHPPCPSMRLCGNAEADDVIAAKGRASVMG